MLTSFARPPPRTLMNAVVFSLAIIIRSGVRPRFPGGSFYPPLPPPPQSDTNSPSYGPRAERSPTRAVGAGGSVGRPRCALPSEALRLLWEFSALHTHTHRHIHTPRVSKSPHIGVSRDFYPGQKRPSSLPAASGVSALRTPPRLRVVG